MGRITYEQARDDHQYLWSTYGPAYDMTGGYVDQEDLSRLLDNPTKSTARSCLCDQITYWFQVGFASNEPSYNGRAAILTDPVVAEIAERHGIK